MMRRIAGGLAALLSLGAAHAAEIPLYPTGPSEDAAFLRFFNAGSAELHLSAANGAGLNLAPGAASNFLTVPAGKPIKGTLALAGQQQGLDVSVEPGEFATVVGVPDSKALRLVTVREQPDDFNALKASLAFYSLDASCAQPGLRSAAGNVAIFNDVADGSAQRRSINPLKLAVQLTCAGAPRGEALDLGQLAAGQRYTVLLAPGAQGPRLYQAQDTLAN